MDIFWNYTLAGTNACKIRLCLHCDKKLNLAFEKIRKFCNNEFIFGTMLAPKTHKMFCVTRNALYIR